MLSFRCPVVKVFYWHSLMITVLFLIYSNAYTKIFNNLTPRRVFDLYPPLQTGRLENPFNKFAWRGGIL